MKFDQWEKDYIDVRLILKGGGCENKNIQYSLPMELEGLGKAGRDLDGIRKCVLHSVYQAQGQGCSAGFIGVGIGGTVHPDMTWLKPNFSAVMKM